LDNAYRRRVGCLSGIGLALAYGLVAINVNRLAPPGVRIYQPPLGPSGNLALIGAGGALLSLLNAWPENWVLGAFAFASLGALHLVGFNFRIPRPSLNFDDQQAIIARFEAGWSLVCIYPTPDADSLCKGLAGANPGIDIPTDR
jgi:hypothetical protein